MITKKTLINAVLIYLLLFVSGSLLFRESPDMYLMLALVFSIIAWSALSDRKINEGFILYLTVYAGFLLIINLSTGGSLSLNSVLSATLKLILAYLILNTLGSRFIESYINIVVLLASVSLVGYLSDKFHLFGVLVSKFPRVGEVGYEGIFYMFRFLPHIERNNSIFFEPGAYQIFLNVALYMLFFARVELSTSRRWIYILLLLVTLFTTFSTTGFLIFSVMAGLFFIKSIDLSASRKTAIFGLLLASLVVFSAQFQQVIINKISDFTKIQDVTDSGHGHRRSFDALVDMEIIKKNIFGVGHKKYTQLFSSIGLAPEGSASSNGITKSIAVYGLPFCLFLFGSYYWAIRKLHGGAFVSIIPFGMLIMFFVGEAYYVFTPFCLALIAAAFSCHRLRKNKCFDQQVGDAPQNSCS